MPTNLSDITGVRPDVRTYKTSDKLPVSDVLVGIEVELENACTDFLLLSKEPKWWSQVPENSLRDDGIEIVTPPILGEDIISAIAELEELIEKINPTISERCGLHVHVDFTKDSLQTLFRFLVLYLIFEKTLLRMCGEGRDTNPYCKPLSSMPVVTEYLMGLRSRGKGTAADAIRYFPKYSAINLHSLQKLGTVEFRAHAATLDCSKILRWVNTLLALKNAAYSTLRPQEIIDSVCLHAEKLYNDIFLGIPDIVFDEETYEEMLHGARAAQEVYRFRELDILKEEESLASALYPEINTRVSGPSILDHKRARYVGTSIFDELVVPTTPRR